MASFADRKVVGDLTFGGLQAEPLRLIDAMIASRDLRETLIAFEALVTEWGGDAEAVGELLNGLVDLMCRHAEGGEADADLLAVIAEAMARAEAPSRPVIERVTGGYAIKRVAPDEAGGKRFWALWRAVLKPLVDLLLRDADRVGACERCDKLFVQSKYASETRRFCGGTCRQAAFRQRHNAP